MNELIYQDNHKTKIGTLTIPRVFFVVVILQLLIFSSLNYFFLIPTNSLRWVVDTGLYSLALLVLLQPRTKPDKIVFLYILLFIANFLSFLVNSNELLSLIKQIRFTFMGGMIYALVMYGGFSKEHIRKLIKTLFFIGYLQLPLVIVQLVFYRYISVKYSGTLAAYVDYAAGSVAYCDSGVLGTFLVIMSIVKIQEGLTYRFDKKIIVQLLLLLAPLGLINSDAQFIFLPLVILFSIVVNKKFNKNTLRFAVALVIVFFLVNALVKYNWEGSRNITKYVKSYIKNKIGHDGYSYAGHRMLRFDSMRYVWNQDIKNPSFSSIIGKGPGYWLTRDSEGRESSITSVWYHCNTVLLMYGELGLLGLCIFLFIPLVIYLETDNSFWGKVIKIQSFYLFLSMFYQHPLNKLSLSITLAVLIVYYRKYHHEKTSVFQKVNT